MSLENAQASSVERLEAVWASTALAVWRCTVRCAAACRHVQHRGTLHLVVVCVIHCGAGAGGAGVAGAGVAGVAGAGVAGVAVAGAGAGAGAAGAGVGLS
jgi:hypothetical protein